MSHPAAPAIHTNMMLIVFRSHDLPLALSSSSRIFERESRLISWLSLRAEERLLEPGKPIVELLRALDSRGSSSECPEVDERWRFARRALMWL
jgi:hypothetical protein